MNQSIKQFEKSHFKRGDNKVNSKRSLLSLFCLNRGPLNPRSQSLDPIGRGLTRYTVQLNVGLPIEMGTPPCIICHFLYRIKTLHILEC
jgi:hypothetical protein